ncbi:MAG: acyl-CoA dehydrogenase family protein [Candidatus Promineifilaceae bacterium]
MISFSFPDRLTAELQLATMVARDVMRGRSRYYDEHEHERPWEYINVMWPVLRDQNKRDFERQAAGTPRPDGASGTAMLRLVLLVEAMSWGDAGIYLCTPGPALGGAAIQAVGTAEQQARFLRRFTEGDPKWGAMAMTEPGAGSDTSAIRTTAVLDTETNEWVLNGEKIFCTNGSLAVEESDGLLVVWATLDRTAGRAGMKPFVVEAGTPGVSIARKEDKLGIRASDTAAIVLNNARIPYENLLGSPETVSGHSGDTGKGFQGAMRTFDATRPVVAASAVGVARAALEFVRERLAEEGVEADYRKSRHAQTAVERDLMEMEARHKAAWLLTLRATAQMDHGRANRLEASMCKAYAGEAVTWITQKAVELLGPLGYSQEYLVEKWMRDAKINDIYEGTRQINLLIVARSILGYSRRELK